MLAWYVFVSRRRPSRMRSMMMLPTSSNPTMAPPLRTFPYHVVTKTAERNTSNGKTGGGQPNAQNDMNGMQLEGRRLK